MTLEEKKLLSDILEAISSIDFHLNSKRNFEEYISNKTIRRAVERELEIIGEVISKLLKINNEIAIYSARFIVDFRYRVTHAHDAVNDVII